MATLVHDEGKARRSGAQAAKNAGSFRQAHGDKDQPANETDEDEEESWGARTVDGSRSAWQPFGDGVGGAT